MNSLEKQLWIREQVQETVSYINKINSFNPEYGIILGSGLGSFMEDIKIEFTLPYNEISNFPVYSSGHTRLWFWDYWW
jgi:purine nucleoside phosphorylase